MSGNEKRPCVSNSTLKVPGGTVPLFHPPTGHVFLSSVAVIRKGRSKGAAECHCNILALRAARVWPRVALWEGWGC